MKKINIYTLCVLLLSGSLLSCNDKLDGGIGSSVDDEILFSSEVLAEQAMFGILVSFAETNSYRGRYIPYYGLNTDAEVLSNYNEGSSNQKSQLSAYDASPNNQEMNIDTGPWAKMYEGIERANLCIEGLRKYGDVENNPVMAQILGECITLRAIFYADLLKAWGDVPARFESVTVETLYLAKSDRDVIYKQLIADLEEAANLVAWPNETSVTSSVERINKAFVKGLRARLCLAAAGYGQRPDGTRRRSTDPDLSVDKMYAIALQECRDIIESQTCTLGDFETTFRELSADVITAGRESLWEIPFASGRGRVAYTYAIKHNTPDQYMNIDKGAGGGIRPVATLFYDFDATDIRRDITCVPYYWNNGVQEPRSIREWYFGKHRYEWMTRIASGDSDDGINWMYMRYADVLLMAAEAINELTGGPTDEAKGYLKQIRSRAFNTTNQTEKVDNYIAALTTYDAFFNAIVEERKFEFSGEAVRKQDLIRWNMLGSKMKETKAKLGDLQKREGAYADLCNKVYYTFAEDGETVIIYGLEHGHTEEIGATLGYKNNKNWFESSSGYTLTDAYVNNLYINDPDERQFWPIFATYINSSNGMLKNDYGY